MSVPTQQEAISVVHRIVNEEDGPIQFLHFIAGYQPEAVVKAGKAWFASEDEVKRRVEERRALARRDE